MTVFATAFFASRLQQLEVAGDLAGKLRRADDFIRLAVVSAFHVLGECKGREAESGGENGLSECGIVLATGFGTMQTNFDVLEQVVSGQQPSPTLFSHSVFNSGAGYLSSIFSICGPAVTLTDFTFSFYRALQEGFMAIRSGRLRKCLVLQVETYSDLLQDRRLFHAGGGKKKSVWEPGVICWLLEANRPTANHFIHPVVAIEGITISDRSCEADSLLRFEEVVDTGTQSRIVYDPLASPMVIDEILRDIHKGGEFSCTVRGQWGQVELSFDVLKKSSKEG